MTKINCPVKRCKFNKGGVCRKDEVTLMVHWEMICHELEEV